MQFQLISPPPLLAEYVKSFWFFESDNDTDNHFLLHSMADGHPELAFHYRGRFEGTYKSNRFELPASYLFGQSNTSSQQTTTEYYGVFGVYLYPFALPQIFGFPTSEMNNQLVALDLLIGREGTELEEMIILAPDNKERVNILSAFLLKKLAKGRDDKMIQASVRHILRSNGTTDIRHLAQYMNISIRQFERKFTLHSGFSPKLFSRIARFQSALNEFKNSDKTLTEIGHECGYYDQSHFIHDFREFSGIHPKLYFSGRAEGTEIRANI